MPRRGAPGRRERGEPNRMSRIRALTPEQMSAEQRQVYEESVSSGLPTGGPYTAYIRTPQFMRLNREMSNYLRSNSLPGRLRQLLVLRTIKHWGAKFPWVVQVRNSIKEGLEQAFIDAIDQGQLPALTSPKDIAAFQVCTELLQTKQVSDESYKRAVELFGENGMVDIVATTGFFTMVSFTANAFAIDPPTD
jgi:4-carboxymuconolactone decarboxylase